VTIKDRPLPTGAFDGAGPRSRGERPLPPGVVLDEAGQRSYEALVADRLPGTDVAAWSLFTFALGAGRRAEAFLSEVVRRHDLDGSQLSVLLVLWMTGPPHRLSPTRLSRNIAQSPSGMTHTVKRLTTSGLVTRVGLESDGRAKHVELTEAGLRVVTRCAEDLAAAVEQLFPRGAMRVEDLAAAQREVVDAFVRL
jgi:DNA-binding MarR family transcriptional regulator